MTVFLGCWKFRRWCWHGVAAVCAAAMVASCGVAGANGGPRQSPAAPVGSVVPTLGSPSPSPVLGYQLNGVAAVSAASAWAVGTTNRITGHVIRWDGQPGADPASGGQEQP